MRLSLVGILEDGSNPSPSLPASARTSVRIPRGSDVSIDLAVVNRSAIPVPIATGDSLTLTIRKTIGSGPALVATGTPAAARGPGHWALAIADTAWQAIDGVGLGGFYVFDAWLTQAGPTRSEVVPLSYLVLGAAATPPP